MSAAGRTSLYTSPSGKALCCPSSVGTIRVKLGFLSQKDSYTSRVTFPGSSPSGILFKMLPCGVEKFNFRIGDFLLIIHGLGLLSCEVDLCVRGKEREELSLKRIFKEPKPSRSQKFLFSCLVVPGSGLPLHCSAGISRQPLSHQPVSSLSCNQQATFRISDWDSTPYTVPRDATCSSLPTLREPLRHRAGWLVGSFKSQGAAPPENSFQGARGAHQNPRQLKSFCPC